MQPLEEPSKGVDEKPLAWQPTRSSSHHTHTQRYADTRDKHLDFCQLVNIFTGWMESYRVSLLTQLLLNALKSIVEF